MKRILGFALLLTLVGSAFALPTTALAEITCVMRWKIAPEDAYSQVTGPHNNFQMILDGRRVEVSHSSEAFTVTMYGTVMMHDRVLPYESFRDGMMYAQLRGGILYVSEDRRSWYESEWLETYNWNGNPISVGVHHPECVSPFQRGTK